MTDLKNKFRIKHIPLSCESSCKIGENIIMKHCKYENFSNFPLLGDGATDEGKIND